MNKIKNKLKQNVFLLNFYNIVKRLNVKYSNNLSPLKITKQDLQEKKHMYDILIKKLIEDKEKYKVKFEKPLQNTKFENFTIMSFNGDLLGKVFEKNGKIYRGIYEESTDEFIKLWESGILQSLMINKYIPKISMTSFYMKGYSLILEIENLPISSMDIWTYSMVKDACITMAIIQKFIKNYNYTLIDGHLNNITFTNGRPMFIDIGSFIPRGPNSFSEELIFTGCYRMLFENLGNCILARNYLYDPHNNSIWIEPRLYNLNVKEYQYCYNEFRNYHKKHSSNISNYIIKDLFNKKNVYPEYIDLIFSYKAIYNFTGDNNCEKEICTFIKKNIQNISSISVLCGSTLSLIDKLYDIMNHEIKIVDSNEMYCEGLYSHVKSKRMHCNIYIYNYMYGGSNENIKVLSSDLVLANDIMKNTKVYQYLRLEGIFNSLKKMTNKYVLLTCSEIDNYEIFEDKFKQFFRVLDKKRITKLNGDIIYVLLGEKNE